MKWVIFLISVTFSVIFLFVLLFTQKGWQYPLEVLSLYQGNAQVTQGNIAIVSIDSRTLDSFSRGDIGFLQLGPDHENVIAKTLENLENYGVSKIAVDIVFANTYKDSTNPIAAVIDRYKNIIIAMRAGVGPMASGHYSAAQADCSSKPKKEQKIIAGVVIEVLTGSTTQCDTSSLSSGSIANLDRVHPHSAYSGQLWGFINQSNEAEYSLLRPKWLADGDTVDTEKLYPSLGYGLITLSGSNQDSRLGVIDRFSYFTKSDGTSAYPIYSFIDVYEGRIPKGLLEGKTIFIGESGELLHDTVKSPINGSDMPGVETHAHYYESLERALMIHDISHIGSIIIGLIIVAVITACFLFVPSITLSWGVMVVLGGLMVLVGRYLFSGYHMIIPIAVLLSVLLFSSLLAFILKYVFIERQKNAIRKAFGRYLDDRVVRDIERHGGLDLGSKDAQIAVIFSDIENFSSYSERLGTKKIFALMSLYLSKMTEILQHHGGTLDKYIGDAVMGFIGAPLEMSREDACQKAFAIVSEWQNALPNLNQELSERGLLTALDGSILPPIRFRAGISYGNAIVGNIGSEDRVSYTAMGDTVNLASRLEAINKYYGTYLCIAQSAYEGLSEECKNSCMLLDRIKVKGKNEGVNIYEILTPESDMNTRTAYKEAMNKYFAHVHNDAKILLESIEARFIAAGFILKRYREEEYQKRVGEDGTFEFHEK